MSHLAFLERHLASHDRFGIVCSADGAVGSGLPDAEFYRQGRLEGGLAHPAGSLRRIFRDLTEVEPRRMRDEPPESPCFGEPFLRAGLFGRDV